MQWGRFVHGAQTPGGPKSQVEKTGPPGSGEQHPLTDFYSRMCPWTRYPRTVLLAGLRIWDPIPFWPWIRDPGWVKKSRSVHPGSCFRELRKEHVSGLKYFNSLMRIRIWDLFEPGSGMEKILIRDPGWTSRIRNWDYWDHQSSRFSVPKT